MVLNAHHPRVTPADSRYELLTAQEVLALLRFPVDRVASRSRRLRMDGLQYVKIGKRFRYPRAAVQRYVLQKLAGERTRREQGIAR